MGTRLTFVALVAVSLISCATVRSWFHPGPPPRPPAPLAPLHASDGDAGVPSFPALVPGPVLRALSVAVGDLSARDGEPESQDALVRCLSRLDAYDAQVIREEVDRWIIYIGPRPGRCFDGGERMLGGDATYEISKVDFRIISAEFGE